jgi:hypothetical protein
MRKPGRLAALVVLVATAALALAAAASGGKVFRETIHDEFEFTDPNFCDAGLTVEGTVVLDIQLQAAPRGPDGLVYFHLHFNETDVFTNPANGNSVRSVVSAIEKDLHLRDNGDGTLTVLSLSTGNAVLYGPSGKAIARNPGQVRVELVIDHGGTPNNPDDDVVLSEETVKGSTGRSDDVCQAAVAALK